MAKLTPGAPVEQLLQEATPEGLIQTFASLTHRLHAAEAEGHVRGTGRHGLRDLRAKRDRVEAEMLRRMAPATCTQVESHLETCTVFRHCD